MPRVAADTTDTQAISIFRKLSRRYTQDQLLALLNAAYASSGGFQAVIAQTTLPLAGPLDYPGSSAFSAAGSVAYSHQPPASGPLPDTTPLASTHQHRQRHTPTVDGSLIRRRPRAPAATHHVHSPPSTTEQGSPLECPFCEDWARVVPLRLNPIQRVNDMQRHMLNNHQCDTIWPCSIPGCGMLFDLRKAYEAHVKTPHTADSVTTTAITPARDVAVEICPQVVWACGYENCANVYEAADAHDRRVLERTAKDYRSHVTGHFRGKSAPSRWSYARRFRNLLVHVLGGAWKAHAPQHPWDPASTLVLRKLLETKHVDDLEAFARCVTALGAGDANAVRAAGLAISERQQCPVHSAANQGPALAAGPPQQPAYSAVAPLGGSALYGLGSSEGMVTGMAATPAEMSGDGSPDIAVRASPYSTMSMSQYMGTTAPAGPTVGNFPPWGAYADLEWYQPYEMRIGNDPSRMSVTAGSDYTSSFTEGGSPA